MWKGGEEEEGNGFVSSGRWGGSNDNKANSITSRSVEQTQCAGSAEASDGEKERRRGAEGQPSVGERRKPNSQVVQVSRSSIDETKKEGACCLGGSVSSTASRCVWLAMGPSVFWGVRLDARSIYQTGL